MEEEEDIHIYIYIYIQENLKKRDQLNDVWSQKRMQGFGGET